MPVCAWYEWVFAITINLGSFGYGLLAGWPSPAYFSLTDRNSTDSILCNGPLTDEQFSWAAAALFAAGMCGSLLGMFTVGRVGRRMSLLAAAAPLILAWLIKATASSAIHIFMGRILAGFACGVIFVATPMYTAEISRPSTRGRLGSLLQLQITLGVLVPYALSGSLHLHYIEWICMGFAVIWAIGLYFCPESPEFLVDIGRDEEALKALIRLRPNPTIAEEELKTIKPERIDWMKSIRAVCACDWSPNSRSLMISCGLIIAQQGSGMNVIVMNMQPMFEASAGNLSPYYSALLVVIVQAIASLVCPLMVDKTGRRPLLLISSAGVIVSLLCLTGYMWALASAAEDPDEKEQVTKWGALCQGSLIFYFLTYCVGYGPIPWVVMGEISKGDVRAAICTIAVLLVWFCTFLMAVGWYYLRSYFGYHAIFFVFAVISCLCFTFILFCVPETKGKTFHEIHEILSSPQKTFIRKMPKPVKSEDEIFP